MNIAHLKHELLDLRKVFDLSVKPYNSFEVDAQIYYLWHVIERLKYAVGTWACGYFQCGIDFYDDESFYPVLRLLYEKGFLDFRAFRTIEYMLLEHPLLYNAPLMFNDDESQRFESYMASIEDYYWACSLFYERLVERYG